MVNALGENATALKVIIMSESVAEQQLSKREPTRVVMSRGFCVSAAIPV